MNRSARPVWERAPILEPAPGGDDRPAWESAPVVTPATGGTDRPAWESAPVVEQSPIAVERIEQGAEQTVGAEGAAAGATDGAGVDDPIAAEDQDDRTGFWARLGNALLVGGVDWVANVAGSVRRGIKPSMVDEAEERIFEMWGLASPARKSPSERALEARDAIKGIINPAWRETFERESGRKIPDPWQDPKGFIESAITQAAGNLGNVLSAGAARGIAAAPVSAALMADQEAAGFVDSWAKGKGLPVDFVAPYASQYGLLSAPVEFVQSAAFAGRGLGGRAARGAASSLLKTAAFRALLKAADISFEGVEEVTQGLIENLVARRMIAEWNRGNPERQLEQVPVWSGEDAWQQFKAGAGMGIVFEGARGSARVARQAAGAAARTVRDVGRRVIEARAAWEEAPVVGPATGGADGAAAGDRGEESGVGDKPPQQPAGQPDPGLGLPRERAVGRFERIEVPIKPAQIDPDDASQIAEVQESGAVVNDFPLDKINFDPERFQFRGLYGERGASGSLKGAATYNKELGGVLSVWYDQEKGRVFVVNGHNRGAKAAELGVKTHAVRFINATSDKEARSVGALINIAEGNASPADAAKFFRDSGKTRADLERFGIVLSGRVANSGLALAALPEHLFNKVVQGEMPEPIGVAIGGSGLRDAQQLALAALVERAGAKKAIDAQVVSELAEEVVDSPTVIQDSGPMLFDLGEREQSLAVERARVAAALNKRLSADRKLFARVAAKKTADKLGRAGNVIDAEANRAVSDDAAAVQEVFNRLKKTPEIGAILNEAAEEVYRGERIEKSTSKAYEQIREAVSDALGRRVGDSLAGVQEGSDGRGRAARAGAGGGGGVTRAGYGGSASGARDAAPVSEGARIDRLGAPNAPTDDPTYTRLPIGLADGMRMARQLGATINLSRARGDWIGKFIGRSSGDRPKSMEVLLRHNLFQLVPAERRSTLLAEAEAEAAASPLLKGKPAALAARAEEIFSFNMQRERAAALKRGAPEALAVFWHEIGHLVDFLPDATLSRGNLLGHLKALSGHMKHMVQGIESRGREISRKDRDRIRRDATRAAGKRPSGGDAERAWRERVSAEYRDALQAEADRRGIVTLESVDRETRALAAWWNGKDVMPDYFESATERYAEVFSVIANNPRAVAVRAPRFWRAWNEFLVARPDAQRAWDMVQLEAANNTGADATERDMREMFARADRDRYEASRKLSKEWFRSAWDAALYAVIRTQAPIDFQILRAENRAMKRMGVPFWRRALPGSPLLEAAAEAAGTAKATEKLDDFRYATSKAEPYYQDVTRLLGRLTNDGLVDEFRMYMTNRHIIENRADIASTLGVDPARSQQILDNMRARAPEAMRVLDQAHDEWFSIRRRHVVDFARRTGMFSEAQLRVMEKRESYVTFLANFGQIADDDPKGLLREMENAYGREAAGTLGFQRGWLGEISDPLAATIEKDRKLIRAMVANEAKRELGALLVKIQADDPTGRPLIVEAKKRPTKDGVETVPIGDRSPLLGDLMWLEDGKLVHYYVPKAYSAFFSGQTPGFIERVITAVNAFTIAPVKRAFVEWAPGSWLWLGAKDLDAFVVQMPGLNPFAKIRHVARAIPSARSIARGDPDPVASLAQERMVIGSRLERRGRELRDEGTLQRELDQFGRRVLLSETAANEESAGFLRSFGRSYMEWANRNNRIWAQTLKIAGMTYIDERFPEMAEWKKKEVVRTLAGNPDFWNRSAAASLLDWASLFWNAGKEGRMAAVKALRENPRDYMTNTLIFTVPVAVMMAAFSAGAISKILVGALEPEEEDDIRDLEEMYRWIPTYEKERARCFPLGWSDKTNKKVIYARLPVSEGQQWAHSFGYSIFSGGESGVDAPRILFGTGMMEMNPGSPIVKVALAWLDFWRGRNPYDTYRGANILTDDEMRAAGSYAYRKMVSFSWNSLASAIFGRVSAGGSPYAPPRGRLERFIQAPVANATLGRWVRVSSGFDEEGRLLADRADRPRAIARLTVQQAVKDRIARGRWNTAMLDAIARDPYAAEYSRRFIVDYGLRSSLGPEAERVIFAPSSAARQEALKSYRAP